MAITSEHEAAEQAMRELLERAGMPQPDEVEHRETSVLLLWHATKLAVVIDLEEGPEMPQRGGSSRRARARTSPGRG
jgi:hypothetical protein